MDRDSGLLSKLEGMPFAPVFIMGLPRSGTTFLYGTLAGILPVASLHVYEVVFFEELLYRRAHSLEDAGRTALDGYFQQRGLSTRQFDEVPLSHDAVEEYNYMLRRRTGTAHVEDKSAASVAELCRKLSYLQGGRETVLLKNPWDADRAASIQRLLPRARFLFIKRDPLRVLDSQVRATCHLLESPEPLLRLLLRGIPRDEAWLWLIRQVYRLMGGARFRKLTMPLFEKELTRGLHAMERSLQELAAGSFYQLDYETFVADVTGTVRNVANFLGLEPVREPDSLTSRPRHVQPLPEVQARADRFLAKLSA